MLHHLLCAGCCKSYGITRKKNRCIALQKCDTLWGAFRAQCSNLSVDKFVWIDETGSDAWSHAQKCGYALRGFTPVTHIQEEKGQCHGSYLFYWSTWFRVNNQHSWVNFLWFYRRNSYHSWCPSMEAILVFVMSMKLKKIFVKQELCYSSCLPMEEAFSFIKSYLRKHDCLLQLIPYPLVIIKAAFDAITTEHCKSWITHSGYYYTCTQ